MDAVVSHKRRSALSRRALRSVTDERLVEQVCAGSHSAFEEIYDRHHCGMLAFCRQILGSQEEAEDVVQETFIAAYQSLLVDAQQVALKAWLYAVARNRCLSRLRARREHTGIDDPAVAELATGGPSVEVERRDDVRALLADVQRLPEDQRSALVLAELGAHSHDEIAVILGVRPAKVKALVFQAREALMIRRQARDADCGEIREQLAVLRGSALRRGKLSHHVEHCAGCRAFAEEVRRQRAGLAVVFAIVPSLALRDSTLTRAVAAASSGVARSAGVGVGGGSMVAGGGAVVGSGSMVAGGGAVVGAKVVAAKVLLGFAVVSGGGGGGYAAVERLRHQPSPSPPAHATSAAQPRGTATPTLATTVTPEPAAGSPGVHPGSGGPDGEGDDRGRDREHGPRNPERPGRDQSGGQARRGRSAGAGAGAGATRGTSLGPATASASKLKPGRQRETPRRELLHAPPSRAQRKQPARDRRGRAVAPEARGRPPYLPPREQPRAGRGRAEAPGAAPRPPAEVRPPADAPVQAGAKPAPAGAKPAPAGGKPAPDGAKPAPAGGKPAPAGGKPAPAGGKPAPAGGQSAPAGGKPAPAGP
jgi:RNA polymerase sigma factor (sigma-70 family)